MNFKAWNLARWPSSSVPFASNSPISSQHSLLVVFSLFFLLLPLLFPFLNFPFFSNLSFLYQYFPSLLADWSARNFLWTDQSIILLKLIFLPNMLQTYQFLFVCLSLSSVILLVQATVSRITLGNFLRTIKIADSMSEEQIRHRTRMRIRMLWITWRKGPCKNISTDNWRETLCISDNLLQNKKKTFFQIQKQCSYASKNCFMKLFYCEIRKKCMVRIHISHFLRVKWAIFKISLLIIEL